MSFAVCPSLPCASKEPAGKNTTSVANKRERNYTSRLKSFLRVESAGDKNLVIKTGLCATTRVCTTITKDRVVRHDKGAHNDNKKRERGRYGAILCARI